jgi:hypothetical protein
MGQWFGGAGQVLRRAHGQNGTVPYHRSTGDKMSTRGKGLQLSFMIHAMVYVLVMVGLWQINQSTSSHFNWAGIVAWGWGIGLAAHGMVWLVFGRGKS